MALIQKIIRKESSVYLHKQRMCYHSIALLKKAPGSKPECMNVYQNIDIYQCTRSATQVPLHTRRRWNSKLPSSTRPFVALQAMSATFFSSK